MSHLNQGLRGFRLPTHVAVTSMPRSPSHTPLHLEATSLLPSELPHPTTRTRTVGDKASGVMADAVAVAMEISVPLCRAVIDRLRIGLMAAALIGKMKNEESIFSDTGWPFSEV
jgi:hypothetical protein